MIFNPELHRRQSFRLKNYDYSQNGAYFITTRTIDNTNLFGKILITTPIRNCSSIQNIFCQTNKQVKKHT